MTKSRVIAIARLTLMFAMGWFVTTQIAGIGLFDFGAFINLLIDNPEIAGAAIASAAAKVWSWWKNNNMTIEAQVAQAFKDETKAMRDEPDGIGDPEEGEEK